MKNVIWGLIIIVIIASCSHKNANLAPNIHIGSYFSDGYVFYILKSNDVGYVEGETHGYIVYKEDSKSKYIWGCPNVSPVGIGKEVGDGKMNTYTIADICRSVNAFTQCPKGWWIPNIAEINLLYLNSGAIPKLRGEYWISEVYNQSNAYSGDFTLGKLNIPLITDSLRIRPIKSF